MVDGARFRFGPRERRGLLVGLGPGRIVWLAGCVLVGVAADRVVGGVAGALAAVVAVGCGAVGSWWGVAGEPLVAWLVPAGTWAWRRAGGPRVSAEAPTGGAEPTRRARRRSTEPEGIRLRSAADGAVGVVVDRPGGAWSVVLPVAGSSLALAAAPDVVGRLADWGRLLATFARADSPVHRVQWVERVRPGDMAEVVDRFERRGAAVAGGGRGSTATWGGVGRSRWRTATDSYRQLLREASAGHLRHEAFVVVSVRAPGGPSTRARAERTVAVLEREAALVRAQLAGSGVDVGRPADPGELAGALRLGGDRPRGRQGTAAPWPMGSEERWAAIRVDDRWHATFWVAEWPRIDVGPEFLAPLLWTPFPRTLSVTMAPVDPGRAVRDVESARTAEVADEQLRQRAGFLTSARRAREAEGVARRAAELADGHAELRFAGYVSVSAPEPAGLASACVALEQAAAQSHLELRRLYGRQAAALTWTLPIGRGLS